MSNLRNVNVAFQDTASLDAFGRLRVSQVTQQIGLKQIYDNLPLFIDTVVNGSATVTHSSTLACSTMVTVAGGDYAISQTKRKFLYSEGKSQEMYHTFYDLHPQTNIIKRIGYFRSSTVAPYDTDFDGFFIESSGGTLTLKVYRTGTLTASAERSTWLDKLDGTGASGLNVFDMQYNMIYTPDFEWLGLGRIRFNIVNKGKKYTFHEFDFTCGGSGGVIGEPTFKGVYMSSGNQPIREEIRQTDIGTGTMTYVCATVGSEGQLNINTSNYSLGTGNIALNAPTAGITYAMFVIRLRSNRTDTTINLASMSFVATTNDDYIVSLVFNGNIAGTLNYVSADGSIEVVKGTNENIVTGGANIGGSHVFKSGDSGELELNNDIKLGSNIDGSLDTITVCITPLSNGLNIYGVLNYDEAI